MSAIIHCETGERQLHLADLVAVEAHDAGGLQLKQHRLDADRQRLELTFNADLIPDLSLPARRAAMAFPRLFNAEGHPTLLEGLVDVPVANEATGVAQ